MVSVLDLDLAAKALTASVSPGELFEKTRSTALTLALEPFAAPAPTVGGGASPTESHFLRDAESGRAGGRFSYELPAAHHGKTRLRCIASGPTPCASNATKALHTAVVDGWWQVPVAPPSEDDGASDWLLQTAHRVKASMAPPFDRVKVSAEVGQATLEVELVRGQDATRGVVARDVAHVAHSFKGALFGPAQKLHGITFTVEAAVRTSSTAASLPTAAALRKQLRAVVAAYDDANLDEHADFAGRNSTCEVFAQAVWRRLVDTWTMSMDGASLRGATLAITVHESDVASVDYTDVVPWTSAAVAAPEWAVRVRGRAMVARRLRADATGGHTLIVDATVRGGHLLPDKDFLIDICAVEAALADALGAYHNQCLNEVPPFCGDGTHEAPLPTSDRVAADVWRRLLLKIDGGELGAIRQMGVRVADSDHAAGAAVEFSALAPPERARAHARRAARRGALPVVGRRRVRRRARRRRRRRRARWDGDAPLCRAGAAAPRDARREGRRLPAAV